MGWGDQALRDQFRWGLRGDLKILLLNFPEQTSLNEAITHAVHCDNRLFEFRQEESTARVVRPGNDMFYGRAFWPYTLYPQGCKNNAYSG